ncbi:MOSC domain-containing protein [Sphingomonas colocasiae]|uniref:MOSC domain-containing protein n=1 Tax=Sphingomonas colocasiae TaxID=1848973 RepID=A0ABS7PX65_9SPHN|nr:MOSC N-terminal beta barrel domain-containing protein [Sphingomonas colocasiae]MBY8825813.1 MOSC domain-containing protein [Sphingomonas colocasiae]
MARIAGIYRYPVKGLGSEKLDSTKVAAGRGIARDRAYAIALAGTAFDPRAPEHLSKVKFATLMTHPGLAALTADFSDGAERLTLQCDGAAVLDISLRQSEDVARFDHFITEFVDDRAKGPLRLVTADSHMFSDIREDCLSIVNLASVDALSAAFGKPIDPLRFRANIYVSGLPAWHERSWKAGDEIAIGGGRFGVMSAISRCAAVNVDLATARIDGDLPALLRRQFGQNAMGVYIDAIGTTRIATGDGVDARNASK